MIAYIFPPIGGSAVHRTLGFVKYLPEFNWRPVVVCGRDADAHGDGWDHSLVGDVPAEAIVIRRPFISVKGLRYRLKSVLGFRNDITVGGKERDQGQVTSPDQLQTCKASPTARPFLRRLFGGLSQLIRPIEYPLIDAGTYWALSVVPLCLRLIRQHKIAVLYSQSYPYSDHLSGLILHKLTGKPWIVDFHDPWSANACFRHAGFRRRVDVYVEHQILRHATKIVAATPTYTQDFASLIPERDPSDFCTIPVGYDEQFYAKAESKSLNSFAPWSHLPRKTTIAHVGYVFPGSAIPFLTTLRELDDNAAAQLRVVFIGGLAVPDMRWLQENPLPIEIMFTPRLPLEQATACMFAADFVLILVADGAAWRGHCPGKLYDYMRSGAPILLSGPLGDTAQILEDSGTGCLLPTDDRKRSVKMIKALIQDPKAFKDQYHQPKPEFISRYERKAATAKLAGLLNASQKGQGTD